MGQAQRPVALILEDHLLIALDVEDTLQSSGFEVPQIFTTCSAALTWLADNRPDVVVLDLQLHDGNCVECAKALSLAGIPFVIYSASRQSDEEHDTVFREARWINKPSPRGELVDAVRSLMSSAAARQ